MPTDEQRAEWKQEAHDKGEKDGANGVYDAPYESVLDYALGRTEVQQEMHESYVRGHDNGEKNPSK